MSAIPWKGLGVFTGEQDSGKSTVLLSTGALPSETIFIDWDLKTQPVADDMAAKDTPFGAFINVIEVIAKKDKKTPLDQWYMINEWLDKTATRVTKPQVICFDNFTPFESAIRAYSMTIMPKISGLSPGQIAKMDRLTWPFTYGGVYIPFLQKLM